MRLFRGATALDQVGREEILSRVVERQSPKAFGSPDGHHPRIRGSVIRQAEMEGKITKAEARGFAVDTTVYPWVAYTGAHYTPTTWFTILTDLEAELHDALKVAQTHLETFGNIWECEVADAHQVAQQIDEALNVLGIFRSKRLDRLAADPSL